MSLPIPKVMEKLPKTKTDYKYIATLPKTNFADKQRLEYEMSMRVHSAYSFLPDAQKRTWVTVSNKGVNSRSLHCDNKLVDTIKRGALPSNSSKTDLARYMHPTKIIPCKFCARQFCVFVFG